jgi:hypothetical protein
MRVNPVVLQQGKLKKQSQFSKWENDFKSILSILYGDFDGPGPRKNKPNQTQSKPISNEIMVFMHIAQDKRLPCWDWQ